MRMINLDETGIKILNRKKDSIYLRGKDIDAFIDGNFTLTESSIIIGNQELLIDEQDKAEIDNVREYTRGQLRETD